MNEKEKIVIENIKKLLEEQNKQKKDLCDHLGVSPSNFGNWVSGRNLSFMKYIYTQSPIISAFPLRISREKQTIDPPKKKLPTMKKGATRFFLTIIK